MKMKIYRTMILFPYLRHPVVRNTVLIFTFAIDLTITWYIIRRFNKELYTQNASDKIRYILFWTPLQPMFNSFEDEGKNTFTENNCEYTNCIVTTKRKMFKDVRRFDAVVFSAYGSRISRLPKQRSRTQKYIMASLESPAYFNFESSSENPAYFFHNYFNWTWTYRLKSDILWRYFLIYDSDGREVGPRVNMNWLEHFNPVSEEFSRKLKSKIKAAAWLVSNCITWSRREDYARKLIGALKKYNMSLDVYGKCGRKKCGNQTECAKMLVKDYYFYLAFENTFDEDYVTEKVLTAIQCLTVPVVLGGANYSRFLPPGSYLDARELSPTKMAETMRDIIANSTLYQDYFRWTNHYTYKEAHRLETCNICKALNNEEMMQKTTVYPDLTKWWTDRQRNIDLVYKKITQHPIFTQFIPEFNIFH